jgi:hypothetical protein
MKSTVEFSPTVIIGLGGTGHGVLLDLKKRFHDEFGGDIPPIVEFLSIDTTHEAKSHVMAADGETQIELEPNKERYMVQVEDPSTLLSTNNPHILRWWTTGSTVSSIISGAQQIRQRGRLALFANYSEIRDKLAQKVDQVRNVENITAMKDKGFYVSERKNVSVFVVCSLAGGTGSGMFLDIAFILRNLVSSANISGVFILPRVFARLPGTDLIKANTYAALKEIESFSTIKDTDTRVINYGIDTIRIKRPPFDMTYIIDSVNERERVIDKVENLNSRVAEGLYILIGSKIGTGNSNAIDNIKSHLASAGLVNTHSASYCSFGVSSCRWQAEEFIAAYEKRQLESARAIINAMMQDNAGGGAAKADAAKFVQERRLGKGQVDNLLADLVKQEGAPKSFRIPMAGWKFDAEAGNRIKDMHKAHVDGESQGIKNQLDKSSQALAATLEGEFDTWRDARQSGSDYLTYGEELAKEVSAKLVETEDALGRKLSETEAALNRLTNEFGQLGDAIEKAKQKPRMWSSLATVKKNIETACGNYNGAIDKQCRTIQRREQVAHALELVRAFRSHVDTVAIQFAATKKKMRDVLDSLVDSDRGATFKVARPNPFEYTLQFMPPQPELKAGVVEFVNWCKEEYGSVYSFSQKTDEEVKEGVMKFVRADNLRLKDLSIDYLLNEALKMKSAGERGDEAKHREYLKVRQALDQLSNLAAPLWRYNESEIPLTRKNINTKLSYCGVPNGVNPPANKYKGSWLDGDNINFIETIDRHRLIFFNITFGIPLFALQGIKEMEQEYIAKRDTVPCHLSSRWKNDLYLIPKQVNSVIGTFALAQVPYFNFIKRDKNDFYTVHLKDVSGLPKEIQLEKGRIEAYEVFKDKLHVVQEVSDAIADKIEGENLGRLKDILLRYQDTLSSSISANGSDSNGGSNGSHHHNLAEPPQHEFSAPAHASGEDQELIKQELEALANYVKEISSH